jgi:VanZ family protein
MNSVFSYESPYKKRARTYAIIWTLLIFILCFIPGNEIPEVGIPLADKWAHLVLFGVFSFLWLCTNPTRHPAFLIILFAITVFIGWLVEYIQGHFISGRTQDNADTFMDAAGGIIGIILFCLGSIYHEKQNANRQH